MTTAATEASSGNALPQIDKPRRSHASREMVVRRGRWGADNGCPKKWRFWHHAGEVWIQKTLSHVSWNRTEAAHLLGISLPTLRSKIRKYSLAASDRQSS